MIEPPDRSRKNPMRGSVSAPNRPLNVFMIPIAVAVMRGTLIS